MSFPKFHGISLANGSVIENLHLERLVADPSPVTAGRIWVNTTQKAIKYTGLDASGNVVVHSFSNAAELTAGVADAKAYTDAQITALKNLAPDLLDTLGEIAAAINNDPDVFNTLSGLLTQGLADAKAEIRGEVTSAFDTLGELEAGLAAETAARTAAVTAEATARAAADTGLGNRLTTAEGEIDTLQSGLSAEITRATAAEQANAAAVAAEATRAQAAEAVLTADIAAAATAGTAATDAVKSALNAGRFKFVASASALVHTITHNLGVSPLLVSVYVEGDDGKYRNDIVAVEETNLNTITIGLTESRKVKVAIMTAETV